MKETAVEWLVDQLKKRGYAGEFPPHLLFEQALEMEKEQMVDTFQDSRILAITNNCSSGEQYYNETFNTYK